MDESALLNKQAVLIYLDGARDALQSAQFNLNGGFYGVAINRAYYAFFYPATALLLTLDLTRSKHSGVMAAFREHFVKPGLFPVHDSRAYGKPLNRATPPIAKCCEKRMRLRLAPLLKTPTVSLSIAKPI